MSKFPQKKIQNRKREPMNMYRAVGIAEGFEQPKNEKEVKQAWQHLVNTGQAWRLQGFFGRTANEMLKKGFIKYPTKKTTDFYGNPIPTRKEKKSS